MLWKVNYSEINFIKGYRFNSDGDPVMRVVGFQTLFKTFKYDLVDKFYSTIWSNWRNYVNKTQL